MKIKMKITIAGTFHGRPEGVQAGDVVEVDDVNGARYCALHYAEPVVDLKEERAVAPVEAEFRGAGEPEPVEPPKRGPGRPPKTPAA